MTARQKALLAVVSIFVVALAGAVSFTITSKRAAIKAEVLTPHYLDYTHYSVGQTEQQKNLYNWQIDFATHELKKSPFVTSMALNLVFSNSALQALNPLESNLNVPMDLKGPVGYATICQPAGDPEIDSYFIVKVNNTPISNIITHYGDATGGGCGHTATLSLDSSLFREGANPVRIIAERIGAHEDESAEVEFTILAKGVAPPPTALLTVNPTSLSIQEGERGEVTLTSQYDVSASCADSSIASTIASLYPVPSSGYTQTSHIKGNKAGTTTCTYSVTADGYQAINVSVTVTAGPTPGVDTDGDGIADTDDNCPTASNPNQRDTDGDGAGDACDTDNDNDGILDENDACPLQAGTADNNGCPTFPITLTTSQTSVPAGQAIILSVSGVQEAINAGATCSLKYKKEGEETYQELSGIDWSSGTITVSQTLEPATYIFKVTCKIGETKIAESEPLIVTVIPAPPPPPDIEPFDPDVPEPPSTGFKMHLIPAPSWNLVTFPKVPKVNFLSDLLGRAPRIWGWNGTQYTRGTETAPKRGVGFWIKVADTADPSDDETLEGVRYRFGIVPWNRYEEPPAGETVVETELPATTGINMAGNPFDVPLPWNKIMVKFGDTWKELKKALEDKDIMGLFTWSPSAYDYIEITAATIDSSPSLKKYQGFWVLTAPGKTITLKFTR